VRLCVYVPQDLHLPSVRSRGVSGQKCEKCKGKGNYLRYTTTEDERSKLHPGGLNTECADEDDKVLKLLSTKYHNISQ
jgi:RecJ-like exonuclease